MRPPTNDPAANHTINPAVLNLSPRPRPCPKPAGTLKGSHLIAQNKPLTQNSVASILAHPTHTHPEIPIPCNPIPRQGILISAHRSTCDHPMLSSNLVKTFQITALLALSAAVLGAGDSVLLDTMNQELQRNYQALKQKADPAPYFMAYEVTDLDTHEVGATLGVLNLSENGHNRYLDVTVRVGDQKLDNYRRVRGDRIQFTSGTPVAIEDVPGALAPRMWLETDRVYRAAADRLIRIKTNQQVKAADRDQSNDFSPAESYSHTEATYHGAFDSAHWTQMARDWSRDFRNYPDLLSSSVKVTMTGDNRYLVSTEGSRIEQGRGFARIIVSASGKAKDGMEVSDFQTFEAFEPSGLPSPEVVRRRSKEDRRQRGGAHRRAHSRAFRWARHLLRPRLRRLLPRDLRPSHRRPPPEGRSRRPDLHQERRRENSARFSFRHLRPHPANRSPASTSTAGMNTTTKAFPASPSKRSKTAFCTTS